MSAEHPILGPLAVALCAFVITWLLAAIIGALRAAPQQYYREKERADKLEQRLTPAFGIAFNPLDQICVHETFLGADEADRIFYVAVVPEANTEASVLGCRGWLTDVRKLGADNETWEPTSFTTRMPLEWGGIGFGPMDINPNMRQALNLVRVKHADGRIVPCIHQLLNKDAKLFDDRNGVFRFDVAVVDQTGSIATLSLRIQIDAASNKPIAREL